MVKLGFIFVLISLLIPLFIDVAYAGNAMTDLETMEKARQFYSQGQLEDAKKYYSKITPNSDFWLESIEERAWAFTRENKFEEALADLQSIASPIWNSQVGPETLMLSTFVSLKICAYKDVIKKIAIFKERMRPRAQALEKLKGGKLPEDFLKLKNDLAKEKVSLASLGTQAENYPRYFYRDKQVLLLAKISESSNLIARLKKLAEEDLAELKTNLKKMKIIEIEMIQKVYLADSNFKKSESNLEFSKVNSKNSLSFPIKDEEVWIDEVGHYQVRSDLCPTTKGNKL